MSRASVPAEDRRPCNRRRCLRSAGRPGVDNRGRSGRGSWWFVHRATGRWPGGTPPFSARSTTVRLDRRGTDQHFSRRAASRRQGMEHFRPDALGRPTNKAVVERLLRTVDRRRIGPAAARLQNMHDAADHTPVIDPRNATGFVRQQRGKPPELFIAQPDGPTSPNSHSLEVRIRQQPNHKTILWVRTLVDRTLFRCNIREFTPTLSLYPPPKYLAFLRRH